MSLVCSDGRVLIALVLESVIDRLKKLMMKILELIDFSVFCTYQDFPKARVFGFMNAYEFIFLSQKVVSMNQNHYI